jgi:hypothetical protein
MKKELILTLVLFTLLSVNVAALSRLDGPLYSKIGQNRACSVYPETAFEIQYQEEVNLGEKFEEVCGNIDALANIYNSNWDPYLEYKDGNLSCPFKNGCFLEIYCCPEKECNENKDCGGLFSKCEKVQCEEWKNGGYKCNVEGLEENIPYQYSEVNYCKSNPKIAFYVVALSILLLILIGIYLKKHK